MAEIEIEFIARVGESSFRTTAELEVAPDMDPFAEVARRADGMVQALRLIMATQSEVEKEAATDSPPWLPAPHTSESMVTRDNGQR